MNRTTFGKERPFTMGQYCALGCLALVSMIAGCPNGSGSGSGAGDGGTASPAGTTAEVITFRIDFQLSELDAPVNVLYSVSTDKDPSTAKVSAFYIPVSIDGMDAAPSDRVVIATDLPIGTNETFLFDPSLTGVGTYRVGVIVDIEGEQTISESRGVIRVEGRPMPFFIRPAPELITDVSLGAEVVVSFDAGDPEDDVQWRVFYLSETDLRTASPDVIGTELGVGQGNVGRVVFSTVGLPAGNYELGISATDSGFSIGATVAAGGLDRIVTIPTEADSDGTAQGGPIVRVLDVRTELPPTLTFLNPSTSPITLFGDTSVDIDFEVVINEPGAIGDVEIFYDDDREFSNGRFPIRSNLPATTTTVRFDTTGVPEGVYFIGGSVLDNANPRVVEYAGGTIELVRTGTLDVLEPSVSTSLKPFDSGDTAASVPIAWETNVPTEAGTVEVFARSTAGGAQEFPLLDPSPGETTITSAEFRADLVENQSGLYEIVVKITFDSSLGLPPLEQVAPALIRVTGLPTVLWLGDLAATTPPFDGAIFEGIQTEDNAGSAFTRVGDLNNDGFAEFVVAARYGKPFVVDPSGIGPGEAYLIYGARERLSGSFNLNAVGSNDLMGTTFTGIRTPQDHRQTDGLASVARMPDVDGDGRDELIFGFPDTNSRGHNADVNQNGSIDPRALSTLEREQQFKRGGVVIVSSTNSSLSDPSSGANVIPLDLVGQSFFSTCVAMEDGDPGLFSLDTRSGFVQDDADTASESMGGSCEGGCAGAAGGDGTADANSSLNYGFVRALARDFFNTYVYNSVLFGGARTVCPAASAFLDNDCLTLHPEQFSSAATLDVLTGTIVCEAGKTCRFPALEFCMAPGTSCQPTSPGLHAAELGIIYQTVETANTPAGVSLPTIEVPEYGRHSGFYETVIDDGAGFLFPNEATEPFGARIIGVGLGDRFGASITLAKQSGTGAGDILISAPGRPAFDVSVGPATGPEVVDGPSGPIGGGEISGLGVDSQLDSGVAYLFALRDLWSPDNSRVPPALPPRPHQYIVGEASHCSGSVPRIDNITATRIAGDMDDAITNIVGIDDFNDDGRGDFAVGVPDAQLGVGRVYIAFRPEPSVEGDYVLEKLGLDIGDADRLDGAMIRSTNLDQFGFSLASGADFNGDGKNDLVIGSPGFNGGVGAIVIVFADPELTTPAGGMTLEDLLSVGNVPPRAVRITGNALDVAGGFGFNVASAGDVDNDGLADLLVAAPGASPRFDPNPNDGTDALTEVGVDTDLDGVADNLENLSQAGIVYVISGQDLTDPLPVDATTGEYTISIDQFGSADLRGYMVAGWHGGDHLGGGDAGDSFSDGNALKVGRGRSFGLAGAGDIDGDGRDDILISSVLADPRRSQGPGTVNGGEAYLIYSTVDP
ncbi:MAG: integrin alpha [Phycisphaerae bacterium]